jgi:hypothetical protein
VFTVRYVQNPYIKQVPFLFEELIMQIQVIISFLHIVSSNEGSQIMILDLNFSVAF